MKAEDKIKLMKDIKDLTDEAVNDHYGFEKRDLLLIYEAIISDKKEEFFDTFKIIHLLKKDLSIRARVSEFLTVYKRRDRNDDGSKMESDF